VAAGNIKFSFMNVAMRQSLHFALRLRNEDGGRVGRRDRGRKLKRALVVQRLRCAASANGALFSAVLAWALSTTTKALQ